MRKLTDILRQSNALTDMESLWGATQAASDFGTLPPGEYTADIVTGEAVEGKTNGTPGYRLTFEVAEGDFAGRRFWHDLWFTERALPQSKRDLAKIGVQELGQLDKPLPAVFRCHVKLGVRKEDDFEGNIVRQFEVLEARRQAPDVFAPATKPVKPVKPEAAQGPVAVGGQAKSRKKILLDKLKKRSAASRSDEAKDPK